MFGWPTWACNLVCLGVMMVFVTAFTVALCIAAGRADQHAGRKER